VGVSLSWKALHGVYIPVGHRVLGDPAQLPRALVLDKLRPLFADPAVKKWGQNIKYDDIVLRRAGVPVHGYDFDTMIASYLLDPERHTHKLDEISRTELGYEMVPYEAVTKLWQGKQVTFDQVDIARATRYAAEDAEVVCASSSACARAWRAKGSASSCATSSSPSRTSSGVWRSTGCCSTAGTSRPCRSRWA
jgi:DNA polymerase-1